tara:strand:+ start:30215 stop:30469 length:255 start_codon:yes stop_codon:yes gene_type:complete
MKVEWEQLAEGVWLLRGLPSAGIFGESPTEFTVVVIDEGGGFAKLLAGERIDSLSKCRALAASIREHGFTRAYAMRGGRKRWYT